MDKDAAMNGELFAAFGLTVAKKRKQVLADAL